jgi:hypothetical protein
MLPKMKVFIKFIYILLLSSYLHAFSYTLEIPQNELQVKIDKKFPLTKRKFLITTIINNPIVKLKNKENNLLISFDIKIMVSKEIGFNANAIIKGKLNYKQKEKSLYFKELEVVKLDFQNIPKKLHKGLKKSIVFLATKYLKKFPVYKIKNKDLKLKLVGALLKDIKIKNNILYVKLGY